MTRVTLEPWEYEWAAHVGTQRDAINRNKQDAAYYDKHRMESDNQRANIMSACGEMAVAKFLNRYWSGDYWPLDRHTELRDRPDISPNIEVRRIRKPNNPLAVRKRDAERGRIMFQTYIHYDDPTQVDVIGWEEAWKAWRYGEQPGWDQTGTARVYKQEKLNDPEAFTDKA